MRQILLIASATVLGFAAAGCELFSGSGGDTPTVEESPVVVSPAPTASPSPGQASPPAFNQPTVQQKPRGILPPDLISSTDPNQRVQQVQGDRSDPFALLPTTPSVQLAEGAAPPTQTTAPTAPAPTATGGTQPQTRQTAQAPRPVRTGGGSQARPANRTPAKPAPTSPIAAAPPRPQPVLARAVEVTGVVQIGDQVYAIVNAPNEPTSRYVQPGQRLAGGQVLVRRIEMNRAEPVVILEQNGVEVVRAVGEGGAAPADTPAAATPTVSSPAT
ncbi:MAG: hypothetical protein EDM05_028045 [Leptolyngbya sp. IPPAS B-1204]|nr:hypothetical protein [Elainella sp. C42_A2020_010]RNJ66803.1 MAG: hypothetical protein EDM05_23990 [Leptolyngbya sp. IPPAS B-1204]